MPSAGDLEDLYYRDFALVYDEMMEDLDYPKWANYILYLSAHYGITRPADLLDLACGTGTFMKMMAEKGWRVTGVDVSASMLAVAEDKLNKTGACYRLFRQDLRELELPGNYTVITCLCDSLNYILDPCELEKALSSVKGLLSKGGIFIADLNTEYKYHQILADNCFAETYTNSAYIWNNHYDKKKKICRMEIDFFLRTGGELFRHFHEVHYQRAYERAEFMEIARNAGFKKIEEFASFTLRPPGPSDERIFYILTC